MSDGGKTALVTGAGVGIGQGVALRLARDGFDVAVHHAGEEEGARETVSRIGGWGRRATAIRADLRRVGECLDLVDEAAEALGGLDVLVNNAGVTRALPFGETDQRIYDDLFDLNVRGYFFCAQRATARMAQRGGGSIVNVSSVHGRAGLPKHAAYATTKGAVDALTRQLAVELAGKKIRVNAVGPGVIEAPRYFDEMPGYTTGFGDGTVPLGRVGKPSDVAGAVSYLASDDADFVTGQVLYVDGGTAARMGLWWE